jgi:hypothetical protein
LKLVDIKMSSHLCHACPLTPAGRLNVSIRLGNPKNRDSITRKPYDTRERWHPVSFPPPVLLPPIFSTADMAARNGAEPRALGPKLLPALLGQAADFILLGCVSFNGW